MPIRFACPRCSKEFTIGDQMAGQKLDCPACLQRVRVPLPPRNKTVLGEYVGSEPAASPKPSHASFACPACGQVLQAPSDYPGGRGKCLKCQTELSIRRAGDGSLTAEVMTRAVVPVRKPAAEADPAPPERAEVGGRPPRHTERVEARKAPPFLTRSGAVVRCPHCRHLYRLEDRERNVPIDCRECDRWFMVLVEPDHGIPFDCPHCAFPMVIAKRMAGEEIECTDCGQPVTVPRSPLMVLKVQRRVARYMREERRREPEPDYAPATSAPGPRLCAICRVRYLRNPLPFCHRCQRLVGLR